MTGKARKLCFGLGAVILLLNVSTAVCSAADPGFAVVGSVKPTTDLDKGAFTSPQMVVEVVLAPRNAQQLSSFLTGLYDTNSANYKHWLAKGEFSSRFAPDQAQIDAVTQYLKESGLDVMTASSPFLLRVSGPSSMMEKTFRTSLHSYVNRKGDSYHANASEVQMPEGLAAGVLGVVGLSDTVRPQSQAVRQPQIVHQSEPSKPESPSCETPYVTKGQLFDLFNHNIGFPYGYGGGPGCNGLTPSQVNSMYDAPNLGPAGKGAGVNLAVFELSAYQHSDIERWAEYFYGPGYHTPLVDITVDGGPLSPVCPVDDECPPSFNGYAGDIEVDADIEIQLAIAPDVSNLLVYNAPNDYTGQTELDEYYQIAVDDKADVVSSSWSVCENDVDAGYVEYENLIFEYMASQGQSMFGAAGDTGAFECLRSDGTTEVNVLDPPSQPWVTSVGGTSFESFNPGANPEPAYPKKVESVWNVDNLCNASANEGGFPGLFWCDETGAGGGGNSQYWGQPSYQVGPGILNARTAYGNGTTQCALAAVGTPCREVPDISANADPYTGYAEYCTGSAATPYSTCATFSGGQTPPGWFAIGGTSLSSPLWSAIIADQDSWWAGRLGNANPLLYFLYNLEPAPYFNDITGIGQSTNNNGLFPTTPGYDLATGIGTPRMRALITLVP